MKPTEDINLAGSEWVEVAFEGEVAITSDRPFFYAFSTPDTEPQTRGHYQSAGSTLEKKVPTNMSLWLKNASTTSPNSMMIVTITVTPANN